jgi:laccase
MIYVLTGMESNNRETHGEWSDGPKYITQCPIKPSSNFTYKVILSTEEGTLWWHAHRDWTRSNVHGAIIIYPIEGTIYPYPKPNDEEIFVLGTYIKFYESYI